MASLSGDDRQPSKRRRMTEEDVAQHLGISRATVSRALYGRGRVSAATRQRVQEAATELGYVPNVMASELAAGRTDTIGLLLRDSYNPAYGLLLAELQTAARSAGLEVVTVTATGDIGTSPQIAGLRRILGMRVGGLIVATGDVPSEQLLPFRNDVPMIRAGRPESHPDIHSVAYHEEYHAALLVDHVLAHGHRRVAVMTPAQETSYPEWVRASTTMRLLTARGATPLTFPVHANTDGITAALDAVACNTVTAIMCPTDLRALELMRAARARGVSIPDDVSVTGCDGVLPGIDLLGLTSVRLPTEALAQSVVTQLVTMLRQPPQETVHELLRGHLLQGTSVAHRDGQR